MNDRPLSNPVWLAAIFVAAAALRIYGLGSESLGMDESLTVERLRVNGYLGLLMDWDSWTQGPLFHWLNEAWCNLFGYSETAVRFPAAIYGTLAVGAVYGLGRVVFDARTGLIAALLIALNPFAIHFSQDARPYSLFLLTVVGSLYFAIRLGQRGSAKDAAGYVVTTLAALYSHPYGPFLLASHAGMFFALRESPRFPALRENPRRIRRCAMAVFFVYCPQLLRFGKHFFFKGEGYSYPSWIRVPTLKDLAVTGKEYFMLPLLAVIVVVLILILLVTHRRNLFDHAHELIALALVPLGLVLLPWIISQVLTPVYRPRYTIGALAAVVLLLAWLIGRCSFAWRIGILIPLTLLHAVPLYAFHTMHDREPWRETAEAIRAEARRGDVVLLHPWWSRRMLIYYLPPDDALPVERVKTLDDARTYIADAKRVWLVISSSDKTLPPDSICQALESAGRLIKTIRINESVRENPWAFRIRTVDLLLYDMTIAGEQDDPHSSLFAPQDGFEKPPRMTGETT